MARGEVEIGDEVRKREEEGAVAMAPLLAAGAGERERSGRVFFVVPELSEHLALEMRWRHGKFVGLLKSS
jgi:hypothetical protein